MSLFLPFSVAGFSAIGGGIAVDIGRPIINHQMKKVCVF